MTLTKLVYCCNALTRDVKRQRTQFIYLKDLIESDDRNSGNHEFGRNREEAQ